MKLKQYGIDSIDRLGRQYTSYFCYLTGQSKDNFRFGRITFCSGCQPAETLTFNTLTLNERYFSTLTGIKRMVQKFSFNFLIGHDHFTLFYSVQIQNNHC